MKIGRLGIWSNELRFEDPTRSAVAAAELDELGFDALWIPDIGGPVFEAVRLLLRATERTTIATGILNIWMHDPGAVAADHARVDSDYPGRFVLGLGVGHAHRDVARTLEPQDYERMHLDFDALVQAQDRGDYGRPLAAMRTYLDALDAAAPNGERPARVLAALGPKMAALAAERTLGVHPYLVPPEHSRLMREILRPDGIVAPAVSVILEADRRRAFETARTDLALYFRLPNYTRNLRRLGFDEADLTGGGSDRLVDALYAWGSVDEVAEKIGAHFDAGADHVCLRVISERALPLPEWRELAKVCSPLGAR